MRKLDYMFVFMAALFQAISLLLGKIAALSGEGLLRYINIWYFCSLMFLGFQAIVWQQALKRLPLSIAYPMMSIVFVIIPMLSYFYFGERISFSQIGGSVLIVAGTILINGDNVNES